MAVANNVVTVTVTTQDGTTVKVYRVVLTKKAVAPDPEDPTDPDSGKDNGDKNTGKDPDKGDNKGDKPGADLSETGAAVLSLGGAPWWRSPSPASPSLSGASAALERIQMLPLSRLLTDGEEAPSITIT